MRNTGPLALAGTPEDLGPRVLSWLRLIARKLTARLTLSRSWQQTIRQYLSSPNFSSITTMAHILWPVELHERVIDACYDSTVAVSSLYSTWHACATTCKDWHPRSRYNLLHEVELRSGAQVDLFVRTITDNPSLADLVVKITVSPRKAKDHVPFARFGIPRLLPRCQELRFDLCTQLFPPLYVHSIAFYSQITHLVVTIKGHSTRTFLQLVWSLPKLRAVTVCGIETKCGVPASEFYCQRLQEMREPSACRELKYVEFSHPNAVVNWPHFPLPGVLGNAIARLVLTFPERLYPHHRNMQAFLSELSHLEILSLDLTPFEPHTCDPVASPAKTWLHGIVSHVTSPDFSMLNIVRRRIDGSHLAAMNRDDALDMFYNEEFRDILQGFPKLRGVNITLWDIHRRMGKFWTHIISRRSTLWPPGLRGIVNFIIMITHSTRRLQWQHGRSLGGIDVIPKHHPRPFPPGVVVVVHKDPEDGITDPLDTPIHVRRHKRSQNESESKPSQQFA